MKRFLAIMLALAACGPGGRQRTGDGGSSGDGGSNVGCENTCSADLHSVVDCNGNVVEACDMTQGCASGACLEACDAAAANKSSVGCDYYSVNPDAIEPDACFAAYVANTWSAPISISVEYNGTSLPIDGFARVPSGAGQSITYAPLTGGTLQPNQVAILFLAQSGDGGITPCPSGIAPAYTVADAAVTGTGYGNAFHITTSAPAVMYDIYPYGGGASAITSATLLLPTTSWDVDYVAATAYEMSSLSAGGSPFVELVGATDNTTVTITPNVAITGGTGVAAAGAGIPTQYALRAGQVLQLEQADELGGSIIESNNPVGVWGGTSCMNIEVTAVACDAAHQELPPVKAMGNHYAAVRYRNRFPATAEESVPWRMIGAVDGTTLTYSPSAPAGAPTTLMEGQVAEFESPGYFTVESQGSDNPFYMAGYMTGFAAVTSGDDHRGDPEYVNIIPPEQYLSHYTFFTDPTYPETNLVLTRERVSGAFADVALDCVGTVSGWMPIDSADDMEYTRVDLVTGNFQAVGNCNNGLHVATSTQPFGLVVWGWGSAASTFSSQAVSYAYPAGASVKQINHVVIQ